jgi:uncharacterized membrane protein
MGRFFKRGLVTLLPLVLTAAIFYYVILFLHHNVGAPLGGLILLGLRTSGIEPSPGWIGASPYLGFALAFALTFFAGILVASFLGRPMVRLAERFLSRLPGVKTIYPHAKQFTEFFISGERKLEFKNAVAVPFPTHGTYSIAFITGNGLRHLNDTLGKTYMTVFVPTAPTPFTGFVCYVPREDIIPLPMSVDEAIRLIISAGILTPEHQSAVGPTPSAIGGFPVPVSLEPTLIQPRKE